MAVFLLSSDNYTLKHGRSKENLNADFCIGSPSSESNELPSIHNEVSMSEMIHSPITSTDVASFSKNDPIVASIIDYVLNKLPEK